MGLVQMYESCFSQYGPHCTGLPRMTTSLTANDIHARSTLRTLLDLKVIPIINENERSCRRIRFGDNDTLASL